MSKKTVCVIGAGPCGLAFLNAWATSDAARSALDVSCFDRQAEVGGQWAYTWRTGQDEDGEKVHSSMYRYLWSNGPKEVLEMANYTFDQHFKQPIPSFPPREVLANYIKGRLDATPGAAKALHLKHSVDSVDWNAEKKKFIVRIRDIRAQTSKIQEFDFVVNAAGHFTVPHVPEFAGVAQFPGRVLHAHDFRDAREFRGKHLLVVGGSYSAEDIALQCHKYGAKHVTISNRSAMGFKWPQGVDEVPLLTQLTPEGIVHFKDGSQRTIDAVILCTGYIHHFPYMSDDLKLRTNNRLWVNSLYKGVVWQDNPNLFYLGMQDQYYTFSMFDLQAFVARDIMIGKISLPTKEERQKNNDEWLAREEKLSNPHEDIRYQTDYCKDLQKITDYPAVNFDMAADIFDEWEHHKEESITGYRNKAFKSPVTGTKAPVHHTPWLEALDDSEKTFMKAKL